MLKKCLEKLLDLKVIKYFEQYIFVNRNYNKHVVF